MRIIAGLYKNRKIETPSGLTTRPILSRIRKSLFDILRPYLEEARMLDLYAGSGIMALEAFSRGASFVLSIDENSTAVKTAQDNHQHICPKKPYRVIRGNVLEWIPRLVTQEEPFDIIGVTPPYRKNLADQTLDLLEQFPHWLKPGTIVFAQRSIQENIRLDRSVLEHVRTKKYGKNSLEFFLPFENPTY